MGRPRTDLERTAFYPETKVVTIGSGGSLTNAIDLDGVQLVGIAMPDAWTAADITFQVSVDGVTWNDLFDADGNEYTVVTGASRFIILAPAAFAGIQHLKVRSGTSGAPVAQGAERMLTLVTRSV